MDFKNEGKKPTQTIVQSDLRNVVPLDGGGQTVDRVPGHTFRHLVKIITVREQIKPQCKSKVKGWKVIGSLGVMNKTLNLQFLSIQL